MRRGHACNGQAASGTSGIEKRHRAAGRGADRRAGVRALVERVAAGEVVAYCSDAGMPGVSDPGLRLVARRRARPVWPVEVLPGATAAATRLRGQRER